MGDDKFLSSVKRKKGWYKSNKREAGDKALQSYLPCIDPPVVNARPQRLITGTNHTKEAPGNCNVSPIWKGRRKYFLHTKIRYRLCPSLALILFLQNSWEGSGEGRISLLLSCFSIYYCPTAYREIMYHSSGAVLSKCSSCSISVQIQIIQQTPTAPEKHMFVCISCTQWVPCCYLQLK